MRTILVTGASGFVGRHLAKELSSQGHAVLGTDMSKGPHSDLEAHISGYFGGHDLTDPESVAKLPLDRVDAVINLAGLAQVGSSFEKDQAERYRRINIAVHTVLADRLVELGLNPRVIAVSTGAVYDNNQSMPLNEDSRIATNNSPYAQSKIAMEQAMLEYARKGLDVVIVRPFNHIGPGQLGGFLVPDLISQVMAGSTVSAGDLSTARDYTDVRDVVKAYTLLATLPKLKFRLYNICSGKCITGQAMLEMIVQAAGKNMRDIKVEVNKYRLRPNDPKKVFGDNSRLCDSTGWRPTLTPSETLSAIISRA
jgi:GDP-4-dehydro-6-deoxy-D-mannose reductase